MKQNAPLAVLREVPLADGGGLDDEFEDANEATLGGLGGSDFDELILETEAPSTADETRLVDEKDAGAPLEVDGGDDDLMLEFDSSAEALVVDPSESTPPSRPPPVGDPDQLLAEASVYLRYGKREQAIENIEAIVAVDSGHRPAFEKLGEAYADGDQTAKAVENWLRAAEIVAPASAAMAVRAAAIARP